MYKYEIIVYWSEEDRLYVAEIPELPGCMADGKTYQEAIKNAQIVISEWLETAESMGREIPQPKGKLAYAQDTEVIKNLSPISLVTKTQN